VTKSQFKKLVSLLTAAFLALDPGGASFARGALEAGPSFSAGEIKVPSPGFELALPPELGTIQSLVSGRGPALIHIQTAHGNYEAQKKIQATLHYLKKNYGVKLLLLEGGASKLDPERLRFFPERPDITMKVAEDLVKEALVTGAELYLLEEEEAEGYGIEDLGPYLSNGKAFLEVLEQREKTGDFLNDLDLQIERLSAPFLSGALRAFLKTGERYERKALPLLDWLSYLRKKAKEHLAVEVDRPEWQLDWPMLFRIFKLKGFEEKLDLAAFAKERKKFLRILKRLPQLKTLNSKLETLLASPLSHHQPFGKLRALSGVEALPDPETGLLFEEMVRALPKDFRYGDFPHVCLFIGHLILQSELKPDRLMKEMEGLSGRIADSLAQSKEAKQVLGLLKDYRLLKRLFALELTPEDYEQIVLKRGTKDHRPKTRDQSRSSVYGLQSHRFVLPPSFPASGN